MDNFDLKKYLAEGRLFEAYDISAEVTVGDKFKDGSADQYEVISVDNSHVELKPLTFAGDTTIFPKDLGDNVSIGEFWQHFEKIEDEPKGMFGEPWDSDYFGNHIRENKLTANNVDISKELKSNEKTVIKNIKKDAPLEVASASDIIQWIVDDYWEILERPVASKYSSDWRSEETKYDDDVRKYAEMLYKKYFK